MKSPITLIIQRLNPLGYVLIGLGLLIYMMKYDFSNYMPLSESGVFIASIICKVRGSGLAFCPKRTKQDLAPKPLLYVFRF